MIRSTTKALLSVGLLALAGPPFAALPEAGGDTAAIRSQTLRWAKAYNGGDAKGVAAEYAEDALLLPPGAPGVRGRAAILAFFEKDIAASKAAGVVFIIAPGTEVGISGDMGWESGTYKAMVNGAVVESGKFLSVSRKRNGKWSYLRDTWNSDAASAPSK